VIHMSSKIKAKENTVPLEQPASNRRAFPKNLNACGLLDQFKPQGNMEQEKRQKVTLNKKERMLVNMFTKISKARKFHDEVKFYDASLERLKPIKIRNSDIQAFIVNLAGVGIFKGIEVFSGMFISALMKASGSKKFDLNVKPLPFRLDCLGYNNTKHAKITGDLGAGSFRNLCAGEVVIRGNVLEIADMMSSNDVLTINGNALIVGANMNFANIVINGNLGHPNARERRPNDRKLNEFPVPGNQDAWFGCIKVNGNIYPSLVERKFSHFSVWQNGKVLMDDGKLISQPENK